MARRLDPAMLGTALALALAAGAQAQQGAPTTASNHASGHEQDVRAIRRVIADATASWNRHDAAGAVARMTDDADMVVPPGTYTAGRTTLEADTRASFAGVFKDARDTVTSDRIRFLRPDVALVDGTFAITGSTLTEHPAGLQTAVLVKQGGQWQIAALRRMIPVGTPPGGPAASAGTPPTGTQAARP